MEVVNDYPPLFDEIDEVFRVRGREVLFAWGNRIYNPMGVVIPPELVVHEEAHGRRQGSNESTITDWWRRYLHQPEFRLIEEVEAHRAEYRFLLENANRRERRAALKRVARRLASPLYGAMVKPHEARRLLQRRNA